MCCGHIHTSWTSGGGEGEGVGGDLLFKFRTVLSHSMSFRPDQSNDESDKWESLGRLSCGGRGNTRNPPSKILTRVTQQELVRWALWFQVLASWPKCNVVSNETQTKRSQVKICPLELPSEMRIVCTVWYFLTVSIQQIYQIGQNA